MVIKNQIAIWITEIIEEEERNQWLIKGLAFDGDYGFGDETIRSYQGETSIISLCRKDIVQTILFAVHSTRIPSPLWSLRINNSSISLPDPPFLITDILNFSVCINELQDILLSQEAEAIFFRDGVGEIYPISTSSLFGILKYKETNTFWLTAFSENGILNYDLLSKEKLMFSEWGITVGFLKTLSA